MSDLVKECYYCKKEYNEEDTVTDGHRYACIHCFLKLLGLPAVTVR